MLPIGLLVAALPAARAGDRDADGLSDAEERVLGTLPGNPDTDGDGLLDGWEAADYERSGLIEPLGLYGADPLEKDIFVEIDWMESRAEERGEAAGPHANAVIAYQAAIDIHRLFRDSGTDIRVHFDLGSEIEELVPADLLEEDAPAFSRFEKTTDPGKVIPYQDRFPVRPVCGTATTLRSLYDVYNDPAYFRPSRRNLFYYLLIAERHGVEEEGGGGRRGFTDSFSDEDARRRGLKPAGVQVGVVFRLPARGVDPEALRFEYGASILHELGHGFGLGHGGATPDGRWNNRNWKPNYPSIMNHRFQFWGVGVEEGRRIMDFSHGVFRPITEAQLEEREGLGDTLPNDHILENLGIMHHPLTTAPYALDWNRNGEIDEVPVHEDLDLDGRLDEEPFEDHDDWGKILRDGFSGIGTRAFSGCGLGCGRGDELIRYEGDFNGDGVGDLALSRGDRLDIALGSRDGALRLEESRRFVGAIEGWNLSYGDQVLVCDLDGDGGDEIFLHRGDRAAVARFTEEGGELLWTGSSVAPAGGGDAGAWSFDREDRLLAFRLRAGVSESLLASNSRRAALVSWDEGRVIVDWTSEEALGVLDGGFPAATPGRFEKGLGGTFFLRGRRALVEVDGRVAERPARRVDVDGVIPAEPPEDEGWKVSWLDCLFPVDLDGDGRDELLVRGEDRVGVFRELADGLRLVWSARRSLGSWELGAGRESLLVGQFTEGDGEEIAVSYSRDERGYLAALGWSDERSALELLAVAEGRVEDPRGERPAFPLLPGQRIATGRFVEGEPLLLLVQGARSLLVARLGMQGFEQVAVHDGSVGAWSLSPEDRFIVADGDGDPEDELHARRGDLLGILRLGARPGTSFLGRYEPASGELLPVPVFLRGDANGDGVMDLSDVLHLLLFLFQGEEKPACPDAADADDNGRLDITDAIRILNHLFVDGRPLSPPGPRNAGTDPTRDPLGCGDEG